MRRTLIVLSIFSLLLVAPLQLSADTEGPKNGGTFVSRNCGTRVWTSPGNIQTSNDVWSQNDIDDSNFPGDCLDATNFSFSLTGCSSVSGITVEYERHMDEAGLTTIKDNTVQIIKGGSAQGTNKAKSPNWPNTDAYTTYGGASDLWGLTWACADITANDFGASMQATCGTVCEAEPDETTGALVDHVRITVDFLAGNLKLLITQRETRTLKTSWRRTNRRFARPGCRVDFIDLYRGLEELNRGEGRKMWEARPANGTSSYHKTKREARRACMFYQSFEMRARKSIYSYLSPKVQLR